jgi:RNA polymerase I-specific transcription initiation factor RRN6
MVSLPMKVSNLSRLAKFRLACKIAVDLYLSSIAVSLRNELSGDAHEPDNPESHQISLPILHKVCEPPQRDSPPLLSSQVMHDRTQNPSLSLPTLRRTPSLYSHGSAASAEATEDPAITRLRQYAVSIEPSPAIGTSSILFHWPSSPGLDPAQYEWDMIRKDTIQDDNIGDSHKRQRDDDRRRRRIETFLDRERMALSEISSQPTFPSFGSQPAPAQNVASSQTTGDLPMTQPGRGTFGSRIAVAKKKLKKRTAGF